MPFPPSEFSPPITSFSGTKTNTPPPIQLVDKAANYQQKLKNASIATQHNAALALRIANHAMEFYNIDPSEVSAFATELDRAGASSDHTSVSQALKHIVRDWADDGIDERQAVFPQILGTLLELFPDRRNGSVRALIPGSGLGRLAHEVADLGGEFSFFGFFVFSRRNSISL